MCSNVTGREFRAVFISTVHTRHHVEWAARDWAGNFGFLDEQKLLNTAVTRAKSWLAVVADPVILCSVGSCSPIWRKYLKRCFELQSVQPSQLSLRDIYTQSQELICVNQISFSDWSTDYSLAPDDIISRLGLKDEPKATKTFAYMTDQCPSDDTEYETDFTDDSDKSDEEFDDFAAEDDRGPRPDTDEHEVAMLERYLEDDPEIYKRCKFYIKRATLAHAVVCDDDSQVIVINERQNFCQALHEDEVVVRITAQKDEVTCNNDVDAYTPNDVEILTETVSEDAGGNISGYVVGILKRAFNPINRTFICRRDYNNRGNMIPLNFRMPIIKIRFCEKHRGSQETDAVCVSVEKNWKHFWISSQSQLFRVKLIKWGKQKFNPLGDVVALVRNAVEKEIDVLETKCGVQKSFPKDAMEQAAQITDKVDHKVEDYCEKMAFTIDEPDAKALDDALSVETFRDGYRFGIHVADVSARVPCDSPIDKEARKRCLEFRAVGREHQPMLPKELSVGICSLLLEKDRPTISVFITTDSHYKIREVVIKRCQVRSRHQLTYEDVEERLAQKESDLKDTDRELWWSIHKFKEAAISWRTERLGGDNLRYRRPRIMSMDCTMARTIVQEMMITANYHVANTLVDRVPCKSPLRRKLDDGCSNDDAEDTYLETTATQHVQLSRSMWIALLSAEHLNDMELIKCLVSNIEHQPQLALESVNPNQQNTRAEYICSGSEQRCNWKHCSLKLPQYIHFTSPMRRYIDIVVHRILLSVIDAEPDNSEKDANIYTKEDIVEICEQCNDASSRARRMKYGSCNIRLCSLLKERSVVISAVVCTITESDIVLLFPNLQSVYLTDTVVKISSLKPSTLPQIELKTLRLQWKQRIYDLCQSSEMCSTNCRVGLVELNSHQHLMQVKASNWKQLLHAVTAEDSDAVKNAVSSLSNESVDADSGENSAENLTSEGGILLSGNHFCEYAATFSRTSLVKVQIAAKDCHPSRPHIQLFHLTPKMCVCVEHNVSVVESFSKPAMMQAAVNRYDNVGHYQKLWMPVLAAEAAYSAVTNVDSIIIHNVDIRWGKHRPYTGTFDINTKFCKERNIIFLDDEEPAVDDTTVKGYVCVRYPECYKPVKKKRSAVETFKNVIDVDRPFTWVGHCVVTRFDVNLDNYVVHLLLKESTCTFPEQLNAATIEWIPKLVPDR